MSDVLQGSVSRVRGSVVGVHFKSALPALHEAMHTGKDTTLEVVRHLDEQQQLRLPVHQFQLKHHTC